jgi:hypothetical protein
MYIYEYRSNIYDLECMYIYWCTYECFHISYLQNNHVRNNENNGMCYVNTI